MRYQNITGGGGKLKKHFYEKTHAMGHPKADVPREIPTQLDVTSSITDRYTTWQPQYHQEEELQFLSGGYVAPPPPPPPPKPTVDGLHFTHVAYTKDVDGFDYKHSAYGTFICIGDHPYIAVNNVDRHHKWEFVSSELGDKKYGECRCMSSSGLLIANNRIYSGTISSYGFQRSSPMSVNYNWVEIGAGVNAIADNAYGIYNVHIDGRVEQRTSLTFAPTHTYTSEYSYYNNRDKLVTVTETAYARWSTGQFYFVGNRDSIDKGQYVQLKAFSNDRYSIGEYADRTVNHSPSVFCVINQARTQCISLKGRVWGEPVYSHPYIKSCGGNMMDDHAVLTEYYSDNANPSLYNQPDAWAFIGYKTGNGDTFSTDMCGVGNNVLGVKIISANRIHWNDSSQYYLQIKF